eukprot:IDg6963t1
MIQMQQNHFSDDNGAAEMAIKHMPIRSSIATHGLDGRNEDDENSFKPNMNGVLTKFMKTIANQEGYPLPIRVVKKINMMLNVHDDYDAVMFLPPQFLKLS